MDSYQVTEHWKARAGPTSWSSDHPHFRKCPHDSARVRPVQVRIRICLAFRQATNLIRVRFTEWARQYGGIFSVRNLCYTTLPVVPSNNVLLVEGGQWHGCCGIGCHSFKRIDGSTKGRNIWSSAAIHYKSHDRRVLYGRCESGYVVVPSARLQFLTSSSATDVWRLGRKALQPVLSRKALNNHLPVMIAEGSQLLFDLLRSPQVSFLSFRNQSSVPYLFTGLHHAH